MCACKCAYAMLCYALLCKVKARYHIVCVCVCIGSLLLDEKENQHVQNERVLKKEQAANEKAKL